MQLLRRLRVHINLYRAPRQVGLQRPARSSRSADSSAAYCIASSSCTAKNLLGDCALIVSSIGPFQFREFPSSSPRSSTAAICYFVVFSLDDSGHMHQMGFAAMIYFSRIRPASGGALAALWRSARAVCMGNEAILSAATIGHFSAACSAPLEGRRGHLWSTSAEGSVAEERTPPSPFKSWHPADFALIDARQSES